MQILNNKDRNGNEIPVMVFRNDVKMPNGAVRTLYKLGLSRKDLEGNYINGYVPVQFDKEIELENRTKIIIKEASLDFYIKDKITNLYVRVWKFDKVDNNVQNTQKQTEEDSYIELTDEQLAELPF